jgi:integrase
MSKQGGGCSEPEWVYKMLIDAAQNPRDKAFASTLFRTAINISEATQFKVTDIDFEKGTLKVGRLKTRVKLKCVKCGELLGKRHPFCPACGNRVDQATCEKVEQQRQRVVPVAPDTLRLLEEYLKWRCKFPYRGPVVFPFSRVRGWQIIRKLGRRAGIKGLHPSSFRQMFITRWMASGLDSKKLQILLGHARYIDSNFEQLRSECKKLWESTDDEERPE